MNQLSPTACALKANQLRSVVSSVWCTMISITLTFIDHSLVSLWPEAMVNYNVWAISNYFRVHAVFCHVQKRCVNGDSGNNALLRRTNKKFKFKEQCMLNYNHFIKAKLLMHASIVI